MLSNILLALTFISPHGKIKIDSVSIYNKLNTYIIATHIIANDTIDVKDFKIADPVILGYWPDINIFMLKDLSFKTLPREKVYKEGWLIIITDDEELINSTIIYK